MTRVFVTGIGCVTPLGNSKEAFWAGLLEGRSGIDRLTCIDIKDLPITIGGEVRDLDFNLANVNDKVNTRKMDKASIFAVVAAGQALDDAKLPRRGLGDRAGAIIGAGLAGLATLQEQTENLLGKGPRGVSPFTIPVLMPNSGPANISLAYDITGPCYNVASACASSGHAMIDAYEALRRGQAEVMVAGGSESSLTRLAISAFANMKAMTKKYNDDPARASRPFDNNRDGFIMSEGASVLILETEESMRQRGAKPYVEMVGYGMTMDSHHLVQPDPAAKGATKAMDLALRMARLAPTEIAARTYVNAHGTSTKFGDAAETLALKNIFGDQAGKLQISSTKSATGHMIGAAGATESAVCALALSTGMLPPTINYEEPDPDCDLDYIPNRARKSACEFAINNTFGFGGHNVSLVFRTIG